MISVKYLGYVVGKLFFDKKRTLKPIGKKILINDCQKIGNYLFKTPLIKGLALNGYEISILASKVTKELAEANPHIKNVIIDNNYRKKSSDIFRNIKTGFKYKNLFDYYIEMVGSVYLREIILMYLLKPKYIIGVERKEGKNLNLINHIFSKQSHMREDGIEVLKYFGLKDPGVIYDISFIKHNKYHNLSKKKPLILYNGLASTKSRSISNREEKVILENLSKISWAEVKKIETEKSVLDLCGLIEKADLVISVDTGVTHIASAFNIPIIVHKSNQNIFPKSSFSLEKSFYHDDLYEVAEDLLRKKLAFY